MSPEDNATVPGVDDRELAAVASELPSTPYVGGDRAERFAQAVRQVVERRAQGGWRAETTSDDVAVFVMVSWPREVGERFRAQPFADPIANDEPVLGRLFFSNADASGGHAMELPTDPNGILDWLDEGGLSDCPIVTAYRGTKTLVRRLLGAKGRTTHEPIRDTKPQATVSELSKALEDFHATWLVTPTCCPEGVWKRGLARQYVPGERPEKAIQGQLTVWLSGWFRGVVRAEHEDHTNIGRIDVRLLQKGESGGLAYWAIVEMKVIRSLRSAGSVAEASKVGASDNVKAIVEGIMQAWAYRLNRDADEGLVEVYDLRRDKEPDLMVRPEVTEVLMDRQPAPVINIRPLFGSAKEARDAGFTGVAR